MRSTILMVAVCVALSLTVGSGVSHAQKTRVKVYDEVGPWRVLEVWSPKNEMRRVCSAYHQLDSGLGRLFVVTFSKNWDDAWRIEFRNERWPMRAKASITASLVDLDTNEEISTGTPFHREKSITFPIGNADEQIRKFQKSNKLHLEVKSPGYNDKLKLPMTKAVIDRIAACHSDTKQ